VTPHPVRPRARQSGLEVVGEQVVDADVVGQERPLAAAQERETELLQGLLRQQVKQGRVLVVARRGAGHERDVEVAEVGNLRHRLGKFVLVEESAPELAGLPQRVPLADRHGCLRVLFGPEARVE
jgi:hypothetical protein